MNFKMIKTLSMATAVAFSAAVAQDDEYEEEETYAPAAQQSSSSGSAFKSTPAVANAQDAPAVQANGSFNVLHGNAYNLMGSEAGAPTISGNMLSPYKMYGSNLLYVEPSGERATLALSKGGLTYMLAMDNTASLSDITKGLPQYDTDDITNLGIITAGIAFNGMGIAVDFGFDKTWDSEDNDGDETDISTVEGGDIFNVKFGMLLGAFDLTANVYWLTFGEEVDTEAPTTDTDNDLWDIGANVALSNAPSAKNFFWTVGLNFLRQAHERTVKNGNTETETTYDDTFTAFQPFANIAFPVMGSDIAQVFVGTNTRIPVLIFDETATDRFAVGLFTTPNILAEVNLSENWIIYGGASYDWMLISYYSEDNDAAKTEESQFSMRTNAPMANAGVRFQYKNLILEASIADQLNSSAWQGLVGHFGALLTF